MRRISTILLLLLAGQAEAQEILTNSLGMSLRLVEGGRFIMGSDAGERSLSLDFPHHINAQYFGNAESPAHPTWITQPYYLGVHEVTVQQFQTFVSETGYQTAAEKGAVEMIGWKPEAEKVNHSKAMDLDRDPTFSWKLPGFEQTDRHPVVGLSIPDIEAFLAWLSKKEGKTYRLPTEAEWEYACRAGTDTWFSFGDVPEKTIHRFANVANVELEKHRPGCVEHQWLLDWENNPEDGFVFTAPVGSLEPNAWGFHDMHGNVWEWCADLWLDTAYNPWRKPDRFKPAGTAVDPVNRDDPQTKANDFRVIRGGSWYTGPVIARSAHRTNFDAPDAACYIGFRVVMDADPAAHPKALKARKAEMKARAAIELIGGVFYANRGLDVELRFENERFTERGLAALPFIPGIEQVVIQARGSKGPVITQTGINLLGALKGLKRIAFEAQLDQANLDLRPLARIPGLEVLTFPRSSPMNDTLMAGLAESRSLKTFSCHGTDGDLTDAGIAQLKNNRGLEKLQIHEARATGRYLADFVGMPLREFETSPPHNQSASFTDEGVQHLRNFPELRTLALSREAQIGEGIKEVLSHLPHLSRLNLEGCTGIPPEAFATLAGLQELKSLDLRNTQADDQTMETLAVIPRLEELRLSTVTARAAQDLTRLFSVERLTIQTLEGGDTSLRLLGRLNRLNNLDMGGPNITGSGLGPICLLPRLDDIKLRCPDLTDQAFDHLSGAKNIRKVRLVERGVQPPAALTNEGMMKMAKAVWLRELWLPRNDTGITEAAIEELKTLMPKTGVIPYTVSWK
ncbi:MAG: sulfatase modifying factor 1 [Kiritimatiellia bacterium]|jgi:sulfatase modifying factor 1